MCIYAFHIHDTDRVNGNGESRKDEEFADDFTRSILSLNMIKLAAEQN